MRYLSVLTVILCLSLSESADAQSWQKSYQKGPANPEAGEEDDPQKGGGYAAPPRSGTMAGATNSIGLDGLELEIPAIKIKLPKLKIPGLTRYSTMPRMLMDEAVAPFVKNFRREFSMEAGVEPNPQTQATPEAGGEPDVPMQKTPVQQGPGRITPAQQAYLNQQRLETRIAELETLLLQVGPALAAADRGAIPNLQRVPQPIHPPQPTSAIQSTSTIQSNARSSTEYLLNQQQEQLNQLGQQLSQLQQTLLADNIRRPQLYSPPAIRAAVPGRQSRPLREVATANYEQQRLPPTSGDRLPPTNQPQVWSPARR